MATMAEETIDDYDLDRSRYTACLKESMQLPPRFKEIQNLRWIKAADTDPVYREALEEWERKETIFHSRIERKSKESAGLQTEIYNLTGFYSVFQGVVLALVSQAQPTVLQCRKFWIPVVLSVLASVVTIAGILQKHSEIRVLKATVRETRDYLEEVKSLQGALRSLGPKFRFENFQEKDIPREERERVGAIVGKLEQLWASWSKFAFFWISLVVFAVVLPVFHWVLLCA